MSNTTQYGNGVVPVEAPAAAAGSLLAVTDPCLYGLSVAFQAILRTQLDAAWQTATTPTGAGETQKFNVHACEDVHTQELGSDLARRQWRWPALTLWRESSRWYQRTLWWDTRESVIRGAYVLPPMTHEFFDRLASIRTAAIATLRSFLEKHGDPSYTPAGGHAGDDVLVALGIEEIWLTEEEYGSYGAGDLQTEHPAVRFRLITKEREMPNTTGVATLTRIDSTVALDETSGDLDIIVDRYTPEP